MRHSRLSTSHEDPVLPWQAGGPMNLSSELPEDTDAAGIKTTP